MTKEQEIILPCNCELSKQERERYGRVKCGRQPKIVCIQGCWYAQCCCQKFNQYGGQYQCLGWNRQGAINAWNRKQRGADLTKEFMDMMRRALRKSNGSNKA